MTDQLGSVDLNIIYKFTQTKRALSIVGHHDTINAREVLEELCYDAEYSTAIHKIWGREPKVEDYTDNDRYIQFLTTDNTRIKDGWYLIVDFKKGEAQEAIFPWALKLLFIGTEGFLRRGFELTSFTEETNDWGI